MIAPVSKISFVDEVAREIRNGIISGYFQPGAKLIEEALSSQMNTSRGPIRSAFVQLEHEGLVTREPNRSVTVIRLTAKDVEEIHVLRLGLETLALSRLCEDRGQNELETLEGIEQSLLRSVRNGAPLEESVELDISFHEMLVNLAHNDRLLAAWQRMRFQIALLIYSRSFHNEVSFSEGVTRHEELLQSVRGHDCGESVRILREHLESLHDWLLSSYAAPSSAGTASLRESWAK
jgi:DNA-binding GntR family transcriptional regulator